MTLAGSTYLNYIDNPTFVDSMRQRQSTSFHFHSFICASKSQFNLLLYPRRTFASVKIEFLTFYVVSHKIVSLMPMPHCLANNKRNGIKTFEGFRKVFPLFAIFISLLVCLFQRGNTLEN